MKSARNSSLPETLLDSILGGAAQMIQTCNAMWVLDLLAVKAVPYGAYNARGSAPPKAGELCPMAVRYTGGPTRPHT